jgi:GDP-4-dehydro-6-deoxy-D-mannose reductase
MTRQIAMIERGLMEPVLRVGNLDTRRDFTDVRDTVRAYAALMQLAKPGEIYNVGSGVGRSIRSVLAALLARSRVEVRVETDPALLRPTETVAFVADTSQLRARTGWQPEISFEAMLEGLLEYWRVNVQGPP